MKKSLALMLALIMVLCMIPTTALAKSNSTVVLHPSVNHTVTGVKVKVGDKIDGHSITKISGYDITVDLGTYNVNNSTFRLPYAKDIWEGVDNNKVDYISWAGSGSNKRSEGASALLANGKNTAYYYFKGAPTLKTFTLNYDANGGTGAPATQTYTATSQYENSHTFTISSKTPTREGYEFKGWAESLNDTAATRQPGGSIVVTGTTTLYAVWGNHEHKDKNGDGYCDTDHECMHEKDQDGYCTVDGCTHPHEGDGACCPKKSDNKPERPKPENTPAIPGLTDINAAVKVKCETVPASHEEKTFGFNWFSCKVGEVTGNEADGYTCTIEVLPGEYVTSYNGFYPNYTHTLNPAEQKEVITLKWDAAGRQWKYTENKLPITFTVMCEVQPPLDKTITIEVSKIWEDDIPGAQSITVGLYANGTKVDKKDITPNEGIWYHNFGPRPLEDNNGRDISYTIVEEPIDGYTPHYYTSGEHDKRLVFRVKNVPTEKTGAIKVSKELSGEGAEKDKEFAFTVTLLEYLDSNEVLDGGEPGYYPLSGIYTFGGFEFRDGKVTFGLKGGESVTISGIPAEYDYTVTESNNAGYTVTSENDKGTIRAKGTAEVKFTNTKSAAPTVSPTPTPTPGGGNGGGHSHYYPTTTPVPVIVIPPKTGDMTIWQSILHFLGIR